MKYKNKISLLVFLLTSTISFAQGFQGKAYYQTKTTFDIKLDSSRISTEQQKQFFEMMRKRLEKVYELSFNGFESIYKEEEQLEQPGERRRTFGGFNSGENYKNTKLKIFAKEQNLMGKEFLVKDSLKMLQWSFQDESKMIGKHFCLKATAIKKVERENFRFGPRNRQRESDEKPKDSIQQIEIIAWYTPEIPVNHGPDEYWGLPGLILEVSAGRTQIVCTKIVINPKERLDIKIPKKGETVTEEEFKEISIKKIKEMQERFGRQRQGSRRSGIRIGG